jgi:hypothetical protein
MSEDVMGDQDASVSFKVLSAHGTTDEVRAPLCAVTVRYGQAVADQMVANAAQESINAAARTYLASTDWYAVRFAETGVAIPEDIAAERAARRAAVIAVDWTVDLTASPEDEPESEE